MYRGCFLWLAASLGLELADALRPVPAAEADRVVVIQNENSPISKAIATEYAHHRGVRHIVSVHCQDSALDPLQETIDLSTYQKVIEIPLRGFLRSHPEIDFIVLTKGIPIRLRGAAEGDGVEWFSLDSRLAALDYERIPQAIRVHIEDPAYRAGWITAFHSTFKAQAWANRFWNSTRRFSHAEFGGYLVTRLDGYTEADAKALITRALAAEQAAQAGNKPAGAILLDIAPKYGLDGLAARPYSVLSDMKPGERVAKIVSEKSRLGDFNLDLQRAADALRTAGMPVELSQDAEFVGHRMDLMGYYSWGSNDPAFDIASYRSLRFAPGALSDTAVSTSGRTFLPTQGGQSLVADLIAQGVTGVKGYSDEPLVQAISFPSIVFDRYTRAWTLAESFYAASALVGWQDIVIGDPLARAYSAR